MIGGKKNSCSLVPRPSITANRRSGNEAKIVAWVLVLASFPDFLAPERNVNNQQCSRSRAWESENEARKFWSGDRNFKDQNSGDRPRPGIFCHVNIVYAETQDVLSVPRAVRMR